MVSNQKRLLVLFGSVVLCLLVGFAGSVFTTPSIGNWYSALNKPGFNPPNWIFAPVWTTLFILMGLALFIAWDKSRKGKYFCQPLGLFLAQLIFNFFWSFIFFYLHNPGAAFGEIVILWVLIALTINSFEKISKFAAWLLVPYILWVSFASILNFAIWRLN